MSYWLDKFDKAVAEQKAKKEAEAQHLAVVRHIQANACWNCATALHLVDMKYEGEYFYEA